MVSAVALAGFSVGHCGLAAVEEKGGGKNMTEQPQLSDFERRAEHFAHTTAQILKLVNKEPGLTTEQIQTKFFYIYNYHPVIDNKLRKLRADGMIESRLESDGLLHWYPKTETEKP